jgi:hypothetical protein
MGVNLKYGKAAPENVAAFIQPGMAWLGAVSENNVLEHVDSRTIHFLFSRERFPLDWFGSYNVDRAKSIIARAPRTSRPVNVALWRAYADHMEWPCLDTGPESTVDCSVPVILATIDEARGRYMLVDGWHRIYKASAEGRDLLEGFYLTEEETKDVFDLTSSALE